MRLCRLLCLAAIGSAVPSAVCADFPNPYPAPVSGARLTPETSPLPSINGARVLGVRPGSEVLFQVPVSGERPMQIRVSGLPSGVKMDSRGLISGKAPMRKGEYRVKLEAANRHGKDAGEWVLKVGDDLCPPIICNILETYRRRCR